MFTHNHDVNYYRGRLSVMPFYFGLTIDAKSFKIIDKVSVNIDLRLFHHSRYILSKEGQSLNLSDVFKIARFYIPRAYIDERSNNCRSNGHTIRFDHFIWMSGSL